MRVSVQAMVRALISTIAPAHMDFTEATVNNSIALIYEGFNDVRLFSSMFSSDLLIRAKFLASIPMQGNDQIGISSSDTVSLDQWKKNDEDIFVLSKILSKAHIPSILSSYQESINSTIVSAVAVSAQLYTTIEKTHINNVRITIPASIPVARRTMLQWRLTHFLPHIVC